MKKSLCLLVVLVMGISLIAGCSSSSSVPNWNPLNAGKEIKVAILGSEDQFNDYQDFFNGADMALEEISSSGTKISYVKMDDEGNYDNAVNIATDVVRNSEYAMAITLQDYDTVGAVAYLFNEGKKPLLIASEALTKTMEYGYAYVLSTVLAPEEQGMIAGWDSISRGVKWAVAVHTSKPIDKGFVNGFQYAVRDSSVRLLDVCEIPESLFDFANIGLRIDAMKPDEILLGCSDSTYAGEMLNYMRGSLRSKISSINTNCAHIFADGREKTSGLTGISNIPSYKVKDLNNLLEFSKKYEAKHSFVGSTVAAQGYDLMKFIAEKIQGTTAAIDFMNNAKSEEGYKGVAELKFNMFGLLTLDSAIKYSIDNEGKITASKIDM